MGIIILRRVQGPWCALCLFSGNAPLVGRGELWLCSLRMKHLLALKEVRTSNQTTEMS